MRLIITGASGFVGRRLVPLIEPQCSDLLLVGRDEKEMRRLFPEHDCTTYDRIDQRGVGFDAVIHLAARNNDRPGTLAEFRAANVELVESLIQQMVAAGVGKLIHVSTIHALEGRRDPYSLTKREAEEHLRRQSDVAVTILNLAAIHGGEGHRGTGHEEERQDGERQGLLATAGRLPGPLGPLASGLLRALRPTTHMNRVAEAILAAAQAPGTYTATVTDRQEDNAVYHFLRRALDWSFAAIVIALLWWLMLAAWLAVKLSSPGHAVLAQQRVGRHEETFVCYKFRSMYEGTPHAGTHEVAQSHVTPVGRVLRATKIDELPQILNLMRGEMSLVGPRPCLPVQKTLIEERAKRGVYAALPGITGLSQIRGIDMSDPVALARSDAAYLDRRTLLLDLQIIVRTVLPGRLDPGSASGRP